MPPNTLFQKEEILTAALKLVREKGEKALTARALAAELGCSVKPIFGLFRNMEEVRTGVIREAEEVYESFIREEMESGKYPLYKSTAWHIFGWRGKKRSCFLCCSCAIAGAKRSKRKSTTGFLIWCARQPA